MKSRSIIKSTFLRMIWTAKIIQESLTKSEQKWQSFLKKAGICEQCLKGTCRILLVLLLSSQTARAEAISPEMTTQIVRAIYHAEGGQRAKKPFGILSKSCTSFLNCQKIAENTVKNNYKRWLKTDQSMTFLEFLASKYAPSNVKNDPKKLNRHWLKNVQKFLYRGVK